MFSDVDNLPALKRWIVGAWAVLAFTLRVLLGSLVGTLLFAIVLYWVSEPLFGVQPWTVTQLLLWADSLSEEAKVGLASSLLTVVGFLVALRSSMGLWQRQTTANLRLATAAKLDTLANELCARLLSVQLFSETVAREVRPLKGNPWLVQEAGVLTALTEKIERFRSDRERVLELHSAVFAFATDHSLLLMPIPSAITTFEKIEDQVGDVVAKIWVQTPSLGALHPNHRKEFVEVVDPNAYEELATQCGKSMRIIANSQGALRARLYGEVLELNWESLRRILQALFANKG